MLATQIKVTLSDNVIDLPTHKTCSKCGKLKLLSEFHKDKNKKYGVRSDCKECDNESKKKYREANKERIKEHREANKEYQKAYCQANKERIKESKKIWCEANKEILLGKRKEYYQANKEILLEKKKEYYQANKERLKEYHKVHYQDNKESIKKYQKVWYESNKESKKEYDRVYRQANKESRNEKGIIWRLNNLDKVRSFKTKRRAVKRKAFPNWARTGEIKQQIDAIYREAKDLELFHGESYHVDHIHPLQSKFVCGLHVPANLQPLPGKENLSKSNSFIPYIENSAEIEIDMVELNKMVDHFLSLEAFVNMYIYVLTPTFLKLL